MKKNLLKNCILCLFVVGLLNGCEKKPMNENESLFFSAVTNPYDYAGEIHNAALLAVASTPGNDTMTSEEIFEIIRDFLISTDTVYSFLANISYSEWQSEFNYCLCSSLDELIEAALNNAIIDDTEGLYYLRIESLSSEVCSNHSTFLNLISEIEWDLYHDNSLSDDQKLPLWGCISIAHHSGVYWYDAFTNELHVDYAYVSQQGDGFCAGAYVADVVGWFAGFFGPKYTENRSRFEMAKVESIQNSRRYRDQGGCD
jgi:hypothetical protein